MIDVHLMSEAQAKTLGFMEAISILGISSWDAEAVANVRASLESALAGGMQ